MIAEICKLPIILNGKRMINIGNIVNINAHKGKPPTFIIIATISVKI